MTVLNRAGAALGASALALCALCADVPLAATEPAQKPGTPSAAAVNTTEAEEAAARFLASATFGGAYDDIQRMTGTPPSRFLAAEFAKPYRPYKPRIERLLSRSEGKLGRTRAHTSVWWNDMVGADDQLRQRMVFALSQIFVVNDSDTSYHPPINGYYLDMLGRNAFGNYRDLLSDVTFSPAMGMYLSYRGNRKANQVTGRMPDENYAREILQLFTIGLEELRMDGTPKKGATGAVKETYTNEDVLGLARVFTGLDLDRSKVRAGDDRYAKAVRMVMNEDRHEPGEKTFLGQTVPAGTGGVASIERALDVIFEHPNVAPFVSRQLIQRFTASDPDPAYVRRVATAFETGSFGATDGTRFGTGERGDLEATLAAILLDPSQFYEGTRIRTTTDLGKVREPVLNFVHWARAFDAAPIRAEREWGLLYDARSASRHIGQMPLGAPSVFNFYRPGYVAPATESGGRGITAPEFQILLNGNRAGYAGAITEFAFDSTSGPENRYNAGVRNFEPDYRRELALIDAPEALADHLDMLLLGGRMLPETRDAIVRGVADIPIRTNTPENRRQDRFRRAAYAVSVAVTAPEYIVRQPGAPR